MTRDGLYPPPLIELALAYHRQPLRYPRLGAVTEPLPAGFAPLMPAFGQALAPSRSEATAASLGASSAEVVAAARFFVRHVLLAPGASPWRVLGLEGDVSLAQVRQHYQLLIRIFHPDRQGADPLGLDAQADTADAMRINAAHEQLRHWLGESPAGVDPVSAPAVRDPEALRRFFQPQEWPVEATATGKGRGQGKGSYPPSVQDGALRRRFGSSTWVGGLAVLVLALGSLLWALREPPARLKVAGEGDKSAQPSSTEVPPRRHSLEPQPPQPAYLTQPLVGSPAKSETVDKAGSQARLVAVPQADRLAEERRQADEQARREEAERQEAARLEVVRQEAERRETARQVAERQEATRQEAARLAAEREEAMRQEAARLEATRKEMERQEAMRREAARLEAEREAENRAIAAREAEAQARLTAEREALERQLAAQRLAHQQELEAQRLTHQQELEAQRLAQERKLEAERKALQARVETEAKAKQGAQEAERQAQRAKAEAEAKAMQRSPQSPEKNPQSLPPDPAQVVTRLTSAYGAGQLDNLVELFTPDAKTTDGQGRNFIRSDYKTLFANTSHRELNITQLQWNRRKDGPTVAQGAFTVRTRAHGSDSWHQSKGRIRLELVPWEGDWRIARMEYQLK